MRVSAASILTTGAVPATIGRRRERRRSPKNALLSFAALVIVALSGAAQSFAQATSPDRFAVTWAQQWNRAQAQAGGRYRIIEIGCRRVGDAIYSCQATFSDKRTGKTTCEALGIGSATILLAKPMACGPTVA